jgi:hypothetical protein
MSAPTSMPIMSEWYFDPSYPDSDKDALPDILETTVVNWGDQIFPLLATELLRNPKRKFAAAIKVAGSSLQVNGAPVHVLLVLGINRGELPLCLVYLGSELFIRVKASQAQEQYKQEALAIPGNEATIAERAGPT